jgi:hypothetical protein
MGLWEENFFFVKHRAVEEGRLQVHVVAIPVVKGNKSKEDVVSRSLHNGSKDI